MSTALIALHAVAKINGVDVDMRTVEREIGSINAELNLPELLRVAKRLEFKARVKKIPVEKLPDEYPLPAIVQAKDGTFLVLLKLNKKENKLLAFLPTEKNVTEMTFGEARELFNPAIVVLSHRAFNAQVRFGFQWFYTEILKYRAVITEVMGASFVIQLFGLVTPLFTQVILDKVIVHRTMTTLDVLAVAFLFTASMEFFLNLARKQVFTQAANKIDSILGAKLFRHLFNLPYVYFEARKVGVIAARVRELDNIREFITSKSVSVIVDLFFSLIFVVMMAIYSIPLTFVVVGFVAVIAVLYVVLTPELRNRLQSKFLMASESQSYLVESVTGIQTVKSLAIEGSMQRKWEDALARYLQSSFNLNTMGNVGNAISNLCQKLMTISILYLGVRLVIENKLTIGQLIAFQMFANQFTNPVLRLVNLWNDFQQALLGVDRLGDILNHPIEVQSSKAITLPQLTGSIEFDKISFRYSLDGPHVIQDLSMRIKPGMSIGLVGKSGSGKSTIAKLIQRLYLPTEGAVIIDGVDVRHMNPNWLRSNIGVVLQENYLFSGSIRENIAMPKPDAPIELIIKVATIAGAHEFISQMPAGYDTLVGERGSTLSGGQRQRIAIARALITNPKILIFDEATSSLDYESERIIQQNLKEIKSGRTFLIIAHRLSTVQDCNVIVVLDKGKIVEVGSHGELLSRNGPYARLYSQQSSLALPALKPHPALPCASNLPHLG
jgi:ATP-binding cassette, subfamily B, bacterial HlyB/CyaB